MHTPKKEIIVELSQNNSSNCAFCSELSSLIHLDIQTTNNLEFHIDLSIIICLFDLS